MHELIKVTETDTVFGEDAVCVLYANVSYSLTDGTVLHSTTPISGIFHVCSLGPRKDKDGFYHVYAWCLVNDLDASDFPDESYWIVIKVPPHGLIELPNYIGEVITRISIAP